MIDKPHVVYQGRNYVYVLTPDSTGKTLWVFSNYTGWEGEPVARIENKQLILSEDWQPHFMGSKAIVRSKVLFFTKYAGYSITEMRRAITRGEIRVNSSYLESKIG